MRLIDADVLKKEWSMGDVCETCARDTRQCGNDYCFTRMDVCGMIDDAPTVGGWVSVKDRLPKRPPAVDGVLVRREWYLVALGSGAVLTISYEFDDERWQTVGSPVTHWMPLPEPPKEESDGN